MLHVAQPESILIVCGPFKLKARKRTIALWRSKLKKYLVSLRVRARVTVSQPYHL